MSTQSNTDKEFSKLLRDSSKKQKFEIISVYHFLGNGNEIMSFVGVIFGVFALYSLLYGDMIGGVIFGVFELIFIFYGYILNQRLKQRIINKYQGGKNGRRRKE
jgi:hypothetical protein